MDNIEIFENNIRGVEIEINTLEQMIKNLNDIKHYKGINKRFLDKLMRNIPKDDEGFDLMRITTYPSHVGLGFDIDLYIELAGRYNYQNHTTELGFKLYVNGGDTLNYSATDSHIVRLEKSLKSQLEYKNKTKKDMVKSLEDIATNKVISERKRNK